MGEEELVDKNGEHGKEKDHCQRDHWRGAATDITNGLPPRCTTRREGSFHVGSQEIKLHAMLPISTTLLTHLSQSKPIARGKEEHCSHVH